MIEFAGALLLLLTNSVDQSYIFWDLFGSFHEFLDGLSVENIENEFLA